MARSAFTLSVIRLFWPLNKQGGLMFTFTKMDLEKFISDIISFTAKDINIQNFEVKSRVELLDEIEIINPEAMELLKKFISAYKEWYVYNYDENGVGLSNLPDQHKVLDLINKRDNTRNELLKFIRS
jgi:hypothetical protein